MSSKRKPKPLGDLRAEADHSMLEAAFYETPDYKSLIEHPDYSVIVGRRGVGKSALFYRLTKAWEKTPHLHLIRLSPEPYQMVGLRYFGAAFGEKSNMIHAGSRIIWRYALIMEIVSKLHGHYKFKGFEGEHLLAGHVGKWQQGGKACIDRLRHVLGGIVTAKGVPEITIADLPKLLEMESLLDALAAGIEASKEKVFLLVDRLDEGYEADALGIGLLVGLVHAAVDINTRFENARVTLFLRDNIYRAICRNDPNYSRSVEGHVLRIHWEEYHLFNMICNRLRVAFEVNHESNLKIWNACVAHDLEGKDGFKKCLKHTLYRPRDLLSLLNQAYGHAFKEDRDEIVYKDVESVAREISRHRLEDLIKEYEVVFPGLDRFVSCFAGKSPEFACTEVERLISVPLYADDSPGPVQQHLAILNNPREAIRSLHSVGFLGVQDNNSKTFVFCHDGKSEPVQSDGKTRMLVHPCYWMALDCSQQTMEPEQAAEIHDEYDIEVNSETPEIRAQRLGQTMSRLTTIPLGLPGATDFEDWCEQSIKIVFAGGLRNIALKPNGNATQRRDIVGTNHGPTPAWKRILQDYDSRQVIFEVKNYQENLGRDEYRQMLSYLSNSYGKLGFIITRSEKIELEKGQELDWMKEMYFNHDKCLIIKLSGRFLQNLLSKLRNPQKHDAADDAIDGLLDMYERRYLSLGANGAKARR